MKKLICWVTFPFSLLQIQNILNCTDTEQLQGSLTDPDLHVISFFPDRIGRDVIRVSEIPFLHFLYSLNHFSHISINAIFLFLFCFTAFTLPVCCLTVQWSVRVWRVCSAATQDLWLTAATVKILNTAYWKACWDLQYLQMRKEQMLTRTTPRTADPLAVPIRVARLGTVRKPKNWIRNADISEDMFKFTNISEEPIFTDIFFQPQVAWTWPLWS